MPYFRKDLPFEYDALEPYMDRETVKLHFEKHHKGYQDKLNIAVKDKGIEEKYSTIEILMKNYQYVEDQEIKVRIREFGGGLINHNFFWDNLRKDVKFLDSNLKDEIIKTWESVDNFKEELKRESMNLFGSGWVWLVKRSNGDLKIIKTFNQDNPWFLKFIPIIGIDLWEHAYYLKHNSDKLSYFEDFWNLIDWDKAIKNYDN